MGDADALREIAETLRSLRWALTGLQMSGIRDFPVMATSSPAEPVEEAKPSQICEKRAERAEPGEVAHESNPEELSEIRREMGECKRCRLHSGRANLVFGDGSSEAGLVFVGEGPGFDEDKQGLPFVGRAGKLLDKMISALGLRREEVYICNVVKCRPPNNRVPNPDEIEVCSQFLTRQLTAIKPRIICALGACAAQTLLSTTNSISRLRGKIHRWRGIPLICTFHPAFLLRNPGQKAATWRDLLEIHRLIRAEDAPRAHEKA